MPQRRPLPDSRPNRPLSGGVGFLVSAGHIRRGERIAVVVAEADERVKGLLGKILAATGIHAGPGGADSRVMLALAAVPARVVARVSEIIRVIVILAGKARRRTVGVILVDEFEGGRRTAQSWMEARKSRKEDRPLPGPHAAPLQESPKGAVDREHESGFCVFFCFLLF